MRFEAFARAVVAEYQRAHARAVERAVSGDERRAEFGGDLRHRDAVRRGDAVRDQVGVDERHAVRGEQVGDGRFAAADAAGQSHRQTCFSLPEPDKAVCRETA